MSIMWKYLDKRAAAIKAIGDYDNMQFIIRNTKDEITVESDRMVGVGSPNMDGMPHAHNPQAGEERILDGMRKKPALRWRLPKRWSKTKSKLIRITVGNRWSTTLNFSTIPCEFIRQDAEDED